MCKSFKEYVHALGYWGLIVIAPIALDALGVYQIVSDTQVLGVTAWAWFLVASILFLLIPFIAFHRVRTRLQDITEDRRRELARLILQVRNAAGKVVLHHMAIGLADEVKNLHTIYTETQISLNMEGEIEGGEIKEIIYGFTSFVGYHVTRLLGGGGPISAGKDPEPIPYIEMDEFRFCGRMGDRADEAIRNIQKVFWKGKLDYAYLRGYNDGNTTREAHYDRLAHIIKGKEE